MTIDQDPLAEYIDAHIDPAPAYLDRIERESHLHMVNGRMCSGHLQGRLLAMLIAMTKPRRVLELGTFSGYSALCMAEALEPDARLVTIEADDELEPRILSNLALSPHGQKVELIIGDAEEKMKQMEAESFDFVFIDADKRRYPQYYAEAKRLLRPGGYILADNTLWDRHVLDADNPKDRQTTAIKHFNELAAADPDTQTLILPIRDGLTLMRLISRRDQTHQRP